VRLALPPTSLDQSVPVDFDLSPSYVDKLDDEFTRVYEEYTRRVAAVQAAAEQIIQLWAELGTPQALTDAAVLKYYRDAPEQLGLHEEDIARLHERRDKLAEEKRNRERRLRELKAAVEGLWERLGVEDRDRRAFLNANRGCGVRQINELEDELARLNELKRQNLHLFVEDARYQLQELWDVLYFAEDDMLEFTPAFSDVYSDALLEAHEREIARLGALKEQRAPALALVEKHKTLVRDRNELAASSQDASRLMMRGQKGEKRDPGKLLREEKMRKRIAKELPKVTAELRRTLEKWEAEYGRPFLVHGHGYLDMLEDDEGRPPPGPRAKTPAGRPALPAVAPLSKTAPPSRVPGSIKGPAAPRPAAKAPVADANGMGGGHAALLATTGANKRGSPSRIPARAPLANLKHGTNSPERPRPEAGSLRQAPAIHMRAPPPKMRDLMTAPSFETPSQPYGTSRTGPGADSRQGGSDDTYAESDRPHEPYSRCPSELSMQQPTRAAERFTLSTRNHLPPARQISNTSTAASGSENWETYDDNSEPELDASDTYYAKIRAARGKRPTPDGGYGHPQSIQSKRPRGLPPAAHASQVIVDGQGNRSASGAEWTDEDAF